MKGFKIRILVFGISLFLSCRVLAWPAYAEQVTQRFGGSGATLDAGQVMDDVWFGYYTRNVTTDMLYHESGKPYETAQGLARRNAVKFDLTGLAGDTRIIKATYVLPMSTKMWAFSASSYTDGLSLYRIQDPSGTGNWDITTLNTRFKRQPAGGTPVPWTADGGTFADCIDPTPDQTVYGVGTEGVHFYFFDLTGMVQDWVAAPETNLGFSLDATVISDRAESPHLRPYLEITYETDAADPPGQVSGLTAFHRSGQTFLTWQENAYTGQFYDVSYKIYRYHQPINAANLDQAQCAGEVFQGSAFNVNRSLRSGEDHNYKIDENQPELAQGTGLYVFTPEQPGQAYYAVTITEEGYENRLDFSLSNALSLPVDEQISRPGAVLQNAWVHNGNTVQEFVHWADETMSYCPGYGFNFMLNVSGNIPPGTAAPLELALTGRGASYRQTWVYGGMVTIWYSDFLPPTPNMPLGGLQDGTVFPKFNSGGLYDALQTWYSGCSSTYKTQEKLSDGVFVPYTENRILHALETAGRRYNIDSNRIYVRGGSMGGTGAMSLGLKYPGVFASVTSNVGCPNWRLNIHKIDDAYNVVNEGWRREANRLWGPASDPVIHENGTPIWDWMNAGWYAKTFSRTDLPFLSLMNGKRDGSIVFFPHVSFYKDMWQSKQGFAAHFFDGGHSSGSSFDPRFGTLLKNESHPALANVSIDDDPGQIHEPSGMTAVVSADPLVFTGDAQGEINGYRCLEWSRALREFSTSDSGDDLVDQPGRYEIALRIASSCSHDHATVDITPRKLQQFTVIPLELYYWENKRLSDGEIVQNGTVAADASGLVTVAGFQV
ncbi:MAG: DNRLRE domain-containing protein, partial [Desulfobacterales bacterium]|nr:DNRLRE domain-containing protein [Desulfobacterales bacterium]